MASFCVCVYVDVFLLLCGPTLDWTTFIVRTFLLLHKLHHNFFRVKTWYERYEWRCNWGQGNAEASRTEWKMKKSQWKVYTEVAVTVYICVRVCPLVPSGLWTCTRKSSAHVRNGGLSRWKTSHPPAADSLTVLLMKGWWALPLSAHGHQPLRLGTPNPIFSTLPRGNLPLQLQKVVEWAATIGVKSLSAHQIKDVKWNCSRHNGDVGLTAELPGG